MSQLTRLGWGLLLFLPFALLGAIESYTEQGNEIGRYWPVFTCIAAAMTLIAPACLVIGKATEHIVKGGGHH